MNDIKTIVNLIYRFKSGDKNAYILLEQYFTVYPNLKNILDKIEVKNYVKTEFKKLSNWELANKAIDEEKLWLRLQNRLQNTTNIVPTQTPKLYPWLKYISIAATLLVIGFASQYYYKLKQEEYYDKEVSQLKAGTNKAILSLPNGEQIALSEVQKGILINDSLTYQNGTSIKSQFQEISPNAILELVTPKGGQYHLILSDQTKVWLNADSRLLYPKRFTDSIREVVVEGEAYFEVAKNKKPFIVRTPKETVRVVGTHFNVESYPREHISRITLSEGKVQVNNRYGHTLSLSPGQQSFNQFQTFRNQKANLDEVLAWKNGEFFFENTKLSDVMLLLSRWYDFEYEVDPSLQNIKIYAIINRETPLSEIFNTIKYTGKNINIYIKERRVIMRE